MKKGYGFLQIMTTAIVAGAAIGGVVWLTGGFNRMRIRKINSFIGFDPNYYKDHQVTMSYSRAKELADRVYSAGGLINDDEAAFKSVLQEAGTVANLSLISAMFGQRHEQSMADYYTWYMDDRGETKVIVDLLKKLKH